VDLFAGIGGFHLAVGADPLQGTCVYACDIDPACRSTYEAAFSEPKHVGGDIKEVTEPQGPDGSELVGDQLRDHITRAVPPHDLLCAGFPCQPFSKSGHQRGVDETRGTLFFDILRVLEARRPKYVLLENVMNLVGPRHRETWAVIVRRLRELGYAVSDTPTVLSPHALPLEFGGRPQHRERVFIPALYVGEGAQHLKALGPLVDRYPFGSPPNWTIEDFLDEGTHPELIVRPDQKRAIDLWDSLVRQIEGRLPGIPLWADVWAGRQLLNVGDPAWKQKIVEANQVFAATNSLLLARWFAENPAFGDLFPSYRKLEWQVGDGARSIWHHAIQFRPSGIRVRPLTYLPALVAINQTSIIGPRARRISIREAARLQGFPDDFPLANDGYRQLGNAVSVGVTQFVARALILGTGAERSEQHAPLPWLDARRIADEVAGPPAAVTAA
jgi:DNA (cytosine-5)-methyltransferase 1